MAALQKQAGAGDWGRGDTAAQPGPTPTANSCGTSSSIGCSRISSSRTPNGSTPRARSLGSAGPCPKRTLMYNSRHSGRCAQDGPGRRPATSLGSGEERPCAALSDTSAPDRSSNGLVRGLKLLEYRGYDSWGLGAVTDAGLGVVKRVGKISDWQSDDGLKGSPTVGVGHTRWATPRNGHRAQRPPAHRRPGPHRRGAQRHHRKRLGTASRVGAARRPVPQRNRHRGDSLPVGRMLRRRRGSTP